MPLDKLNILIILTDQQSAHMMTCTGNRYVQTPAMDRLAASGMRFQRAYCCNPMCGPSRFALMTGRLPSAIGMRNNEDSQIESVPDAIINNGLGWLLDQAGYETAYGGKFHLPNGMTAEDIGFQLISNDERDRLADDAVEFINRERNAPFALVASFVNPHDICYMAIRDSAATPHEQNILARGTVELATLDEALQMPEGLNEEKFYADVCPPLPPNFERQVDEPEAIGVMQAWRPFKANARASWDERRWRLHRWAYARLTEFVDAQIGRVLDAVRDSGQWDNTLILFTSDHGDMDAAHRMEHKTAFYEEAAHIPLIVHWPGVTTSGSVNSDLVSNGLDLLPTLCDVAGVNVPEGLVGQSLRPLAEGNLQPDWRRTLPVESEIGRMIVTERYKYMCYDTGDAREQLIDLVADPGEMRNAINDPGNWQVVEEHRKLFGETFYKRQIEDSGTVADDDHI